MPYFVEVKKTRKAYNCYFDVSHVIVEKSHCFTFHFLDNLRRQSKHVCDACREKYSGFPTISGEKVKPVMEVY